MFNTKKRNERVEQLKNAGVDTTKYFEFKVNEDIPKGSTLRIVVEDDDIKNQILNDGHIKVDGLYRRWVMAQYLKMTNYEKGGYHGYLNNELDYDYTMITTLNEIRVLYNLEKKKSPEFEKRKQFFSISRIKSILKDYAYELCDFIKDVYDTKILEYDKVDRYELSLSGLEYQIIGTYYFIESKDNMEYKRKYNDSLPIPCGKIVNVVDGKIYNQVIKTYDDLYANLCYLIKTIEKIVLDDNITYGRINNLLNGWFISLPKTKEKSKNWVEAFKRNGVYYTLQNMIQYHNIKFIDNEYIISGMELLDWFTFEEEIETYKLHGKLIELLEKNNFNLSESIRKNFNK